MPGACLIDVYDTILQSRFLPRMRYVIEPLGVPLDDWLTEWEPMREDRDTGRVTFAASIARTLRALGRDAGPGLAAVLARRDTEYSRASTRLCEDTVPFLNWLRSAGVRTALVSNCADTTRSLLDYLGVLPLVDAAVLSCEAGFMKPHPEIYQIALDKLGVAEADSVFIDDQPSFCAGAQALGIRPVQIIRGGGDHDVSASGFPVIRTLLEAKPLL